MSHTGMAAALAAVAFAVPAAAQDVPRGDLFAGYSLLRADGASLHGAEATLAWSLWRHLGIVIDADTHETSAGGFDQTRSGLFAGPRLSIALPRVTPFVHALVGAARRRDSVTAFQGVDVSETHTELGGAAGGGVDVRLGARWAIRAQADYRAVRVKDGRGNTTTEGGPRLAAGVVFRFAPR